MRSRPAPKTPTQVTAPDRLRNDPQVRRWIQRLEGDPSASPSMLSEEKLRFVVSEVARRRGPSRLISELDKAMDATLPVLAAPESRLPISDLRDHVFAQPEMLEMWRSWTVPAGKRGPKPPEAETKALMCVLAMTGHSAHVNDAYETLCESEDLRKFFAALDSQARGITAPALPVTSGTPTMVMPSYARLTSVFMKRAAAPGREVAWKANVAMLKELKRLYPTIGRRLMVEGTNFPSWTPQRGGDSDALRGPDGESGFRAYAHTSSGKRDLTDTDSARGVAVRNVGKWWRGWYAQGIFDQATGLMIVGRLFPADEAEHHGLIPLVSQLFELWPELDGEVELLAGDSSFDNDATCRMLEVDYGIHPVFRLHRPHPTGFALPHGASRDATISGYTDAGRLRCTRHGRLMDFRGMETPKRFMLEDAQELRLKPGVGENENDFRIRAECSHPNHGCGRKTLRAKADWNRLTYYPHYPEGRPDLYAMRIAMLARLTNQAESYWQRLKSGRKVATSGTDRGRMADRDRAEAIFALACTSQTALVLADQRIQHGVQLGTVGDHGPTSPEGGSHPAPRDDADETQAGPVTAPRSGRRRGHLTLLEGGQA